jgi:hypothetical protein
LRQFSLATLGGEALKIVSSLARIGDRPDMGFNRIAIPLPGRSEHDVGVCPIVVSMVAGGR